MYRDEEGTPEEVEYLEALRRLQEEGYEKVETDLYAESLAEHLDRVRSQPEAAARQRVRMVREEDAVQLHRVQRAGGRTFVDETPQATVRPGG